MQFLIWIYIICTCRPKKAKKGDTMLIWDMTSVFHAFASVHCCLVVTCWERADFLAFVCDVELRFVTFLCGILGQVWYLIVSIPELCHLSYSRYGIKHHQHK